MKKITADLFIDGNGDSFPKATLLLDESGKVIDFLKHEQLSDAEFFKGVITPGFINSHCHSELSHLFGKITENTGLHNFILEIEKQRKASVQEIIAASKKAIHQMKRNGIVAVGDICNSQNTNVLFESEGLLVHRFIELFAFLPERAEFVFERGIENYNLFSGSRSITLHAPYSASDKLILLVSNWAKQNNGILSFHNQESADENLLFKSKSGKILERLKLFGIDVDFWSASGKNSLETTLEKLQIREQKIMLVHNTFSESEDINFAEEFSNNIYWCFCPRANIYIENRLPKVDLFIEKKCKIVLGTDSLASNYSLDILEEIKTISFQYPDIPLNEYIKWACSNAAEFFGWSNLGMFKVGSSPGVNLLLNADNMRVTQNIGVVKLY